MQQKALQEKCLNPSTSALKPISSLNTHHQSSVNSKTAEILPPQRLGGTAPLPLLPLRGSLLRPPSPSHPSPPAAPPRLHLLPNLFHLSKR